MWPGPGGLIGLPGCHRTQSVRRSVQQHDRLDLEQHRVDGEFRDQRARRHVVAEHLHHIPCQRPEFRHVVIDHENRQFHDLIHARTKGVKNGGKVCIGLRHLSGEVGRKAAGPVRSALTRDEGAARSLPFSDLADAGLAKIERTLSTEKVRDLRRLLDCLYIAPLTPRQDISDMGPIDPALLPAFEVAFLRQLPLRFSYRDGKGTGTRREVEPPRRQNPRGDLARSRFTPP